MAEQTADWILDTLVPAMEGVRSRRIAVENEWLLNYRAWQGWPAQQYMLPLPDGSIYYYIPHARRAIERNVKRGTKLLLPNIDWHQTLPFDGESHQNAEGVHDVMRYVFQKKIPTKRNVSSILRCLQLYNFSVQHTSVMFQGDNVWPWQDAVDPFNFYVFPETATTTQNALFLFEDCIIPFEVYRSFVNEDEKKSHYVKLDVDDLTAPDWPYHLIERLAYRGITHPSDYHEMQSTSLSPAQFEERLKIKRIDVKDELKASSEAFVSLSKIYFRRASRWYYAVIARNTKSGDRNCKVVRLDEAENQPLYRWTTTRPLPGELYLNSPMDDIRVLQSLCNNAISDVEANRSQVQSNPIAIDAGIVGRMQQDTWGNRKIWKVPGNPNELIHSIDVEDVSTNGIRAWQIYLGLLDKGSGGTLAEGQPGRNMPRAGFASQNLLNMALVEIEDDADTVETDILTTGLADVYHVFMEYVPSKQLIKIPSKNIQAIKAYRKADLEGDYSFTWLGSLGFQDSQSRADKFLQMFQMIFHPNVLPMLMQQLQEQGMTLDVKGMLDTLYSYGLGERNLGNIVIPLTQQQIQKMNQPDPAMQMKQQELQQKSQESQQKMQLEGMKAQANLQGIQQKGQIELQKGKIELAKGQQQLQLGQMSNQGKLIDIQDKRMKMLQGFIQPINPKAGVQQ